MAVDEVVAFPAGLARGLERLPQRFEPVLLGEDQARMEVVGAEGSITVLRCDRGPLRKVLADLLASGVSLPETRVAVLLAGWEVDASRMGLTVAGEPASTGLLISKVDLRGKTKPLRSMLHPAVWATVAVERLVFPYILGESLTVEWGAPRSLGDLEALVR